MKNEKQVKYKPYNACDFNCMYSIINHPCL